MHFWVGVAILSDMEAVEKLGLADRDLQSSGFGSVKGLGLGPVSCQGMLISDCYTIFFLFMLGYRKVAGGVVFFFGRHGLIWAVLVMIVMLLKLA